MVEYSLEFQLGLLKVPSCFNGSLQLSKYCRLKIHVIFFNFININVIIFLSSNVNAFQKIIKYVFQ